MVHVHGQLFEELREFVFLFYSLRVCVCEGTCGIRNSRSKPLSSLNIVRQRRQGKDREKKTGFKKTKKYCIFFSREEVLDQHKNYPNLHLFTIKFVIYNRLQIHVYSSSIRQAKFNLLPKPEFKIDQINAYANNLHISYCVNIIQWYSFCFRFD